MSRGDDIEACVRRSIDRYLRDLDGEKPAAIYPMVIACVEKPMLEAVMRHAGGNQSLAAEMLGINRNTLRKKLVEHDLLD